MSVSVFDHPLLSGLLGSETASRLFSLEAELGAMVGYEIALASAQAQQGLIPPEAGTAIEQALSDFVPDIEALQVGVVRDGLVVPELVKQMRNHLGEVGEYLHVGSTSQDVIDTALIIRLKQLSQYLDEKLSQVISLLNSLRDRFADHQLMGVTRLQNALPIMAGHRVKSWIEPLVHHQILFEEMAGRVFCVQTGGAVGDDHKMGERADNTTQRVAEILGLGAPGSTWHSGRDRLVEFANWTALVTGSLGKMGQDMALMAQNDVGAMQFASGGGSSAMPHKQNPVRAEILVALARFNATQASAMQHAMIHELERSGSAWTLEWMVLPQMASAAAASLENACALLADVERIGSTA